ncbi:MAG: hypothetical protein PUJ82_06935 [Spirochaetales bacterium]|nr:hypothetical protein [Spirochaetia bacterium]MDD7458947.1 hypothetical protein [Spirochaetales bacterium]MDD7610633.1 hypothetical protein [Spirochaetales bacterium]MDY5915295.1 hypothetical protein [Treponema sp.]
MKKIIGLIAALFTSAVLFAAVPAKNLIVGVHDFATHPSSDWEVYDGFFTKFDVTEQEYVFTGYFTVKILLGYSRYNFTCTVKNGDDDFTVELSNMESFASDKKGKIAKGGKRYSTSERVATQYAAQMKDEINRRIAEFENAGRIDEIYTTIITYPPVFYLSTATMSKLAVKKYIEQNIDGQTVELDVKLESIDENKNPITGKVEKYAYKAVGQLGSYSVYIYSNNDKLVSAKIGSDYTVKGTVSIDYLDMLNNPWIYKVNEE